MLSTYAFFWETDDAFLFGKFRMPIESAINLWLDEDPDFDADEYRQAWADYWKDNPPIEGYRTGSICNGAIVGYGPPRAGQNKCSCNGMQRYPKKAVMTGLVGRSSRARSLREKLIASNPLGTLVSFAPKTLRRGFSGGKQNIGCCTRCICNDACNGMQRCIDKI